MFTLASLVFMFTHSLKAKSFYHRLLVVSHSLLPSPLRVVCLERLVWCFPFEKLWHRQLCRWRGWVNVTGPLEQWLMWLWVCVHKCVCVYESVLEWAEFTPQPGPICRPLPPFSVSLTPYTPPPLALPLPSTLAAQISTMCTQGSSAGLHTPLDMGLTSPVCSSRAGWALSGCLSLSWPSLALPAKGAELGAWHRLPGLGEEVGVDGKRGGERWGGLWGCLVN